MSGKMNLLVINKDEKIEITSDETILQAALRQGVDFPNVCRVGGCGTCKCRLIEGDVLEMTETGYILSEREIEQGYILACQSRAKGNIKIAVNKEAVIQSEPVKGKVIKKEMLTLDIARIDVQLTQKLNFKAGQFAKIILPDMPNETRSYSFSAMPTQDNIVSFTVRRVPGGKVSPKLVDHMGPGDEISIQGPGGDFWLRDGDKPVLMVAGGSGLAPFVGMIEGALERKDSRKISLLFGARTQKDLYYTEKLKSIEAQLPNFSFVPVLSQAKEDSSWSGFTGIVTEYITKELSKDSIVYLCGPPAMVDAAEDKLIECGVPLDNIYADRFLDQRPGRETGFSGDAELPKFKRPEAGILDYLKFWVFHIFGIVTLVLLLAGGEITSYGFLIMLVVLTFGDYLSGEDITIPRYKYQGLLTAPLWMALPAISLLVFCAVWVFSPGDPMQFGAWLSGLTGFDLLAAKANTVGGHAVSAFCLTGLMIGFIGTIPAHELTHRTWDPRSMFIGRWLLAFSFDTGFSIEHVYGHHRYVSSAYDPATAPRGRNVYYHIIISTIKGNIGAWKIEVERLKRKKLPIFSYHNVYLRGQVMSLLLVVASYLMGGFTGTLYFIGVAIMGKSMLEIVNYMEHYGIVRNPELPVQPRHSWNTNSRLTSWAMFNLSRHSHHHAQGEVPYEDLLPLNDAPMMLGGYLSTMFFTLVPPLWYRLMIPKLKDWDENYASEEEKLLLK